MTFLNPAFLWGILGAAVPVIIHLWGRRRPRTVLFPSLRLIRAGQKQQRTFSRLRDLLILLLRVLAIILVSVALAGPMVGSGALARLLPAERTAVVVVDSSASMGYSRDGRTNRARAIASCDALAQRLGSGFRVSFATAADELRECSAPQLDGLRAVPIRASLVQLLGRSSMPGLWSATSRVFIISDLQETAFRGELATPFSQPPVIIDVGDPEPGNRAIVDAVAVSACPLVGQPLEVEATVNTWGKPPADGQPRIAASTGGNPVPGQVLSGEQATQTARLRSIPREGGDCVWQLSLPDDALPVDDSHYLVARVRERLRVLIVADQSYPGLLSLALSPGGETDTHIDVRKATWTRPPGDLSQVDLVILADCPEAHPFLDAVRKFTASGGGAILFAGPDARPSKSLLQALFGAPLSLGKAVAPPAQEPLVIAELDTQYPALSAFANPRAGNVRELEFTRRREITGADRARVIARFSDGGPAIIAGLGPERNTVLLNTTLDAGWTSAPFHPAYVPLVHRLCYDVVGPVRPVWPDWFAGQDMRVTPPEGASEEATITGPDGEESTIRANAGEWLFRPPVIGVYTASWAENGSPVQAQFAANLNPLESDLRRISQDELKRRLHSPDATIVGESELDAYLRGADLLRVNLAPGLLLLALALLIAEMFLKSAETIPGHGEELVQ